MGLKLTILLFTALFNESRSLTFSLIVNRKAALQNTGMEGDNRKVIKSKSSLDFLNLLDKYRC
jgi:hypothetical protein